MSLSKTLLALAAVSVTASACAIAGGYSPGDYLPPSTTGPTLPTIAPQGTNVLPGITTPSAPSIPITPPLLPSTAADPGAMPPQL